MMTPPLPTLKMKLVEMYNAQIEAADPEDIERTISSIDSSAVSVVVLFEGAEFCGKSNSKARTEFRQVGFPI